MPGQQCNFKRYRHAFLVEKTQISFYESRDYRADTGKKT